MFDVIFLQSSQTTTSSIDLLSLYVAIAAIAISIFAILFPLIQNRVHHNQNLTIQSFEIITGLLDKKEYLAYRRMIYSANDWSDLVGGMVSCAINPEDLEMLENDESLSAKYSEIYKKKIKLEKNRTLNKEDLDTLHKIHNHVAWKTAVNYDNVCFLLTQNPNLKNKIIEFHGTTILKVFVITQGLMQRWKNERGRSDHVFFHRISQEIWEKHHEQRRNAIANLITSQDIIYVRNIDSAKKVDEIPVVNYGNWGKQIFNYNLNSEYASKNYEYNPANLNKDNKSDNDDLGIKDAKGRKNNNK